MSDIGIGNTLFNSDYPVTPISNPVIPALLWDPLRIVTIQATVSYLTQWLFLSENI